MIGICLPSQFFSAKLNAKAKTLADLYCLKTNVWKVASRLFKNRIKVTLDTFIYDIISNESFLPIYSDFVRQIFSIKELSVEARLYLLTESMNYMLGHLLSVYTCSFGRNNPCVSRPPLCDGDCTDVIFFFDYKSPTLIEMLGLSSEDLYLLRKVLIKILSGNLKKLSQENPKKIKSSCILITVIKEILKSKLPSRLKVPAIIIALYMLIEKVGSAIREDFYIVNCGADSPIPHLAGIPERLYRRRD